MRIITYLISLITRRRDRRRQVRVAPRPRRPRTREEILWLLEDVAREP